MHHGCMAPCGSRRTKFQSGVRSGGTGSSRGPAVPFCLDPLAATAAPRKQQQQVSGAETAGMAHRRSCSATPPVAEQAAATTAGQAHRTDWSLHAGCSSAREQRQRSHRRSDSTPMSRPVPQMVQQDSDAGVGIEPGTLLSPLRQLSTASPGGQGRALGAARASSNGAGGVAGVRAVVAVLSADDVVGACGSELGRELAAAEVLETAIECGDYELSAAGGAAFAEALSQYISRVERAFFVCFFGCSCGTCVFVFCVLFFVFGCPSPPQSALLVCQIIGVDNICLLRRGLQKLSMKGLQR
eukprot:SAG31_NODE_2478_length_5637_cov_2.220657_6_plen_299_part_00